MAVGTSVFPATVDTAVELIEVTNGAASTIGVGGVTNVATTVPVTSTTGFPATGVAFCESEAISYTGKTSTTLTGCVRGFDGTTAAAHAAGVAIYGDYIVAAHHKVLSSALVAVEAEVLKNPVKATGIITDGTGNNTATINAQMTALAATQGAQTGGATLVLPAGIIMVGNLLIPNHVTLAGQGVGTVLRAVTGTTGAMIALAANHNRFTGVRDLRIDGNSATVTGISLDTQDVASDEYSDGHASILNIPMIHNCGVDGVYATGRGEHIFQNIRVRDCTRYGFNIEAVDNDMSNCMAGGNGSAGFRFFASNNRVTGCKAFYNGLLTPADGHGFWFDGTTGATSVTLTNCEAQDNIRHGFYAKNFDRANMIGCFADSNNAGHNSIATQNGDGFHLDNSYNCMVIGEAWQRGANTLQQQYGLGLTNGSSTNKIRIISTSNQAGHVRNGWHTGNDISINAYNGQQDVNYAASITPNPTNGSVINIGALTGNITINAPAAANTWTGQRMTLIFAQDATGGRVITFASAYVVNQAPLTAPSAKTAIEFIYNGTDWMQEGAGSDDGTDVIYRLTADRAAMGPTIADVFAANSAIPLVAGTAYEVVWYLYYTKTTAGTVTYTVLSLSAPTRTKASYEQSAIGGIGTNAAKTGAGVKATTATAVALPATGSLTTAVDHFAIIRAVVVANAAGNVRLRATSSAGTITPLADSYVIARKLPATTGSLVA